MVRKRWLKKGWLWGLLLAAPLLLQAGIAFAQEQQPRIVLQISGQKEVIRIRDGKKAVILEPMDKIGTGDVLVYTVTYLNSGKSLARDVTVVNPIPEHTVYIPGSAAGRDTKILFSINGGATYLEPPVFYKSRDNAGKEIVQPATPEMYTHIKWIVQTPVTPNGKGTTNFKVKVK